MLNSRLKKLKALLATALLIPAIAFATTQPLDRIAVIVNDDIIMQSQVQEALDLAIFRLKQSGQTIPPKKLLIQQVVEGLIMESIQLQIAERGGVRIDDTSLNEAMARIAAQNNMSLQEFQQAVIAEGSDYTAMREQIRRELITTRARQGSVGPRIQITDQEVQNFLNSREGQEMLATRYHIGHILINMADNASEAATQQAEQQANALFQQLQGGADFSALANQYSTGPNAEKGGDMGWRTPDQLPSLFADAIQGLKPGEVAAPIRSANGYHLVKLIEQRGGGTVMQSQAKVRHILIQPTEIRSEEQAEALIHDLYQRIQQGEDFAELARLYSADPGSRAKGGELGWVNGDALVPSFRKVMESIPVRTLSEPFQSRYGWHILEVLERRQQDIGSEATRRAAHEVLYKRKFNEELEIWLREIRDSAFVDVKI
ncbi:MAG: peptidylprolyl isomerase [Pseudomonadales bacterium]|jgi:peptidyl-prolyl cis-trans isomerase SurA